MSSSSSILAMKSLPKTHPSHLLFNQRHSPSTTTIPFSTLSFHFLPPPLTLSSSIKASSSPSPKDNSSQKPQNPFSRLLQTLNPISSPFFEPIYVVIAATSFFLMRFQFNHPTVIPPPAESPTAVTENQNLSNEAIGEKPLNIPGDAESLRSLVEAKVRDRKLGEAIRLVNRLIELKPEEFDLHLLKAHLHSRNGEPELAKREFEAALTKDPFNREAYRGLLMATSESNEPVEGFVKRVEEVVRFFEEEKRENEAREFKLLIAQGKVMEEDYFGALKVYEEIVKEEPRDFRAYLCQGVVYTLLRKKDEAEKQFEEYRKLVPENHPYREVFEDNTKIFSQKIEKEGIGAKS